MKTKLFEMAVVKQNKVKSFCNPEWVASMIIEFLKDRKITDPSDFRITFSQIFDNYKAFNQNEDMDILQDIHKQFVKDCNNIPYNNLYTSRLNSLIYDPPFETVEYIKEISNKYVRRVNSLLRKIIECVSKESFKQEVYDIVYNELNIDISGKFDITKSDLSNFFDYGQIKIHDGKLFRTATIIYLDFSDKEDFDGIQHGIPYFNLDNDYKIVQNGRVLWIIYDINSWDV